MIKGRGR